MISRRAFFAGVAGFAAAVATPAFAKGPVFPKPVRTAQLVRQVIEAHNWFEDEGKTRFGVYLRDHIVPSKCERLIAYMMDKYAPSVPLTEAEYKQGASYGTALDLSKARNIAKVPDKYVPVAVMNYLLVTHKILVQHYYPNSWRRYARIYLP